MILIWFILVIVVTIFIVMRWDRGLADSLPRPGDVLQRELVKPLYWKKGAGGEAYVRSVLERLGPEYTVFNDVTFRSGSATTQIDHLVVSRYGIFVIETKDYQGKVYGSEKSEQWTQYIGREEHKFYNPVRQNNGHVQSLRHRLGAFPYVPIVAFVGDADLRLTLDSALVVGPYGLTRAITQFTEAKLSQEQLQYANMRMAELARELSQEEKAAHAANVWRNVYDKEMKIWNGICPKCGAKLVRRRGPSGEFLGCSAYPKCKFTRSLD